MPTDTSLSGSGTYATNEYAGMPGDGTTDESSALEGLYDTTIPAAGGTLLVAPGTHRIGTTAELAFDDDKGIFFQPGAVLSVDSGVTLTIGARIVAGRHRIFAGAGTVVLEPEACDVVYPEWFGARETSDDSAAFQAAVNAANARVVEADAGVYALGSTVTISARGGGIVGQGRGQAAEVSGGVRGTVFRVAANTTGIVGTANGLRLQHFRVEPAADFTTATVSAITVKAAHYSIVDLELDRVSGSVRLGTGILFEDVNQGEVRNVAARNCRGWGFHFRMNASTPPNAISAFGISAEGNLTGGILVEGSDGGALYSPTVQGSAQPIGIKLDECERFNIYSAWLENASTGTDLIVDGCSAVALHNLTCAEAATSVSIVASGMTQFYNYRGGKVEIDSASSDTTFFGGRVPLSSFVDSGVNTQYVTPTIPDVGGRQLVRKVAGTLSNFMKVIGSSSDTLAVGDDTGGWQAVEIYPGASSQLRVNRDGTQIGGGTKIKKHYSAIATITLPANEPLAVGEERDFTVTFSSVLAGDTVVVSPRSTVAPSANQLLVPAELRHWIRGVQNGSVVIRLRNDSAGELDEYSWTFAMDAWRH